MDQTIPFPAGARLFRLRPDLADELCLFDDVRAPLKTTDIDEFLGKLGVTRIALALVHVVEEHRRTYVRRRFVCFYSVIKRGATMPMLRAYDGVKVGEMALSEADLFVDTFERGAAGAGLVPPALTVLLDSLASPASAAILSKQALLHDTVTGLAAVLPFRTATAFVKEYI